jgi:hypothetical protein
LALAPEVFQKPRDSFQMPPRSSSIWSPELLRTSVRARASDRTAEPWLKPVFASLPLGLT